MAEEEGDDRPKNSSPPSNRRHNNNTNNNSNGDSIATPRHRHHQQQPNSNGNNVRSNTSWKKSLACSVITLLCLIQYWTSFNYFMFDSKEVIIHKMMDLPQPNDPNDALHNHHHHHYSNTHNNNNIMDDYSSYFQYFLNITTPQPLPTLVHYDPHFLGGYRNQHMRFVSFIHYAVTNSIPQILLNSLRWGVSQGKHSGKDAPFEYLFDVIYWNENAERMGLPRLVRYDGTVLEGKRRNNNNNNNNILTTNSSSGSNATTTTTVVACFNTSSNLYSGLNEQLIRNPKTNIRKVNIWEEIGKLDGYSHCRQSTFPTTTTTTTSLDRQQRQQHQVVVKDDNTTVTSASAASDNRFTYLIAHGGSKGVGRLWTDYNAIQRQRGKATQIIDPKTNRTITVHPEHHPVEKAISTILRPSEAIRNAINSAIQSSIITTATATTREGNVLQHKDINNKKEQQQRRQQQQPKFLALHPRIEHDMLQHRCSRFMEQNLTKIFNHLKTTKELLLSSHNTNFNLVFIAVNAELVLVANDGHHQFNSDHIREIALENSIVLNRTRIFGLFGNESGVGIPVFESGSRTAENILFPEEHPPMDYSYKNKDSTTITTPRLVSSESLGITSLVASIVNFFTIVEAERFVGVRGSSFSTDLFAVRYYMGKGGNYILSPEGVEELVGPPPAHSCG